MKTAVDDDALMDVARAVRRRKASRVRSFMVEFVVDDL